MVGEIKMKCIFKAVRDRGPYTNSVTEEITIEADYVGSLTDLMFPLKNFLFGCGFSPKIVDKFIDGEGKIDASKITPLIEDED